MLRSAKRNIIKSDTIGFNCSIICVSTQVLMKTGTFYEDLQAVVTHQVVNSQKFIGVKTARNESLGDK